MKYKKRCPNCNAPIENDDIGYDFFYCFHCGYSSYEGGVND